MKIETVAIDSLVPDPGNVRKHDAKNLSAIKGSLARFGQQKPIVVDSNGVVVAGNGTLEAARSLGWKTIDVARTTLKGAEAIAFAIADNRSAELATWDDAALAETLAALQNDESVDHLATGYSDEEIAALINESLGVDGEVDEDDADTSSKLGDIEFRVVVTLEDEDAQAELIERLEDEGYKCQALMS